MPDEVPVLIVGGSLVGLSAAMFLGIQGISALVVERHRGTAIHPRAGHFHLRTLELMRAAGIETDVRAASEKQFDLWGGINAVESLAGKEIAKYIPNLNIGVEEFSPSYRLFMTQQELEPILRGRAQELGAELNFATEFVSLTQDSDGVTVKVRNIDTLAERTIRARYLIAADGNRSPIRESLGIGTYGHGLLSNSVTIYFRADCVPLLRDRNLGVIYVFNDTLRGFLRFEKGGETGFLVVNTVGDTSRPEATRASEGLTKERAIALVRSAIGVANMAVEIEDINPWIAECKVAERFQEARVFLAGDAAHVMPPNGGFGGNTGVQDAHNIAWKIALALRGAAGAELLSTYTAERQPVGALTVEQAYTRYVTRTAPYLGTEGMQPIVDEFSMEIGYRYHSPAILSESDDDGGLHEHPRLSRGRPGSRAPHLWLTKNGERISTLDLFARNFVLLAGPEGGPWIDGAQRAARKRKAPGLDAHRVGHAGELGDADGRFSEAYGISPSGAVMMRPDGFVAWRAKTADNNPAQTIERVLASVAQAL